MSFRTFARNVFSARAASHHVCDAGHHADTMALLPQSIAAVIAAQDATMFAALGD